MAVGSNAYAQSTNATQVELQALVQKVQAKLADGKKTEADLADELKAFDQLKVMLFRILLKPEPLQAALF